jgi:hypothetical protein
MDTEKVRNNRAFVMGSKARRALLNLLRSTGGANPEHMALPGYSGQVLTYRGVPVLVDDFLTNAESKGDATDLASVYLASLDADEGLFLGVPGGTSEFDVEADPRRNLTLGWRIESLGALEAKAHRRTRVQWYGALGLRSDLALARASELIVG